MTTIKPIRVILKNPFDAHMHWRIALTILKLVAKYSMRQFSGGLLMPNIRATDKNGKILSTHILDLKKLLDYVSETTGHVKEREEQFLLLFTYYLAEELDVRDIKDAWDRSLLAAIKYYPEGGTTGSDKGLQGFSKVTSQLEFMEKKGIPLLIHGETPKLNEKVVSDFKREKVFLENELVALVHAFPGLPIVLEHITLPETGYFVLAHPNVRATITPQHCLMDYRALFNGLNFVATERALEYDLRQNGMFVSRMCRPILKSEEAVRGIQTLLKFQASTGLKKFGLGTDTAPHVHETKFGGEPCTCGMFTAPIALEMYAMAFEQMGILDHLEIFACDIMPEFYGIKDRLPKKTIVMEPIDQVVAKDYDGIKTPLSDITIPWTARLV